MRLANKVALISGGGSGIGAATARLFAAEGAKVVVTGRRPGPIEAVAAEVEGVAVAGDTTDPAHAAEAVAAAVSTFGGLDVVVANAGIGFGGSAGDVDDEHWQRTLDVNLTGPLVLTRAALPALLERGGGSIVMVSSINGLVATTDSAAYGTSKAGLIGLARSIAVDYGPRGYPRERALPGLGGHADGRRGDGLRWEPRRASTARGPTTWRRPTCRCVAPPQPRRSRRAASSWRRTSRRS